MAIQIDNHTIPTVSIIVPCYNQADYMPMTLDSVLAQTFTNWECILVNDGATDNTEEVAAEYCQRDSRFVYHKQHNQGLSAARNAGLQLSKGEYIQFLDADDILLPTKLEKQVSLLESSRGDVCVCHHSLFTCEPSNIWENEFSQSIYDLTTRGFLYNWGVTFVIAIHSGLFKKAFLQNNRLHFDENVRACEDWLFWTSLAHCGAIFSESSDKLVLYRVHTASMTQDKSYMQSNRVRVFVRMYEYLPESEKSEFLQRGTDNLVRFFAQSNRNVSAEQRANSIDYKFGAAVLRPLHKLSSWLKHL